MERSRSRKNPVFIIDALAVIVLVGLAAGYYRIITRSFNVVDESCYLSLAHRFFLGDCPITEEWHVNQMTGILLLPPFAAFYAFTHSTEGVVLFFRALYTVCQMLVIAYLYFSLRRYGEKKYTRPSDRCVFAFGALLAAAAFACFIPVWVPTLSYYTMSLMGLAVLSVTLFCYPAGKLKYVFCGLVFAAVVLAEPAAFLLYLLLTLGLLLTRPVNRFFHRHFAQKLSERRFWLWFTLGGCLIALPLTVFIFARCTPQAFWESFPHLFESVEYVFSGEDSNIIDFALYRRAILLFGPGSFLSLAAMTALAAALYRFRRYTRLFFAVGSCVCLITAYAHAWRTTDISANILFHGLPLYLCAPLWMLLAAKPDRRICGAWVCCALFSAVFSTSSAIAVGWGGIAAGVFSVMLMTQVGIEALNDFALRDRKNRPILSLAITCFAAAALFTVTANELQWFSLQTHCFFVENLLGNNASDQALDVRLTSGPLKGIATTRRIAAGYDATIRDLDRIRERTDRADSVFVAKLSPFCYLHLDRDYGTYSSWFRKDEFFRLRAYWSEHPDKLPDYIYLSYFDQYLLLYMSESDREKIKTDLSQIAEYDVIPAEIGEILRLRQRPAAP